MPSESGYVGDLDRLWKVALKSYSYPAKLNCYEHADRFPYYFNRDIIGDRNSTIEFENYFREYAPRTIEVYFEIVFWKLYSQKNFRQRGTTRIINHLLKEKINPISLYDVINRFLNAPNRQKLRDIRNLIGIKTDVLAIALTYPAFLNPEKYPMVDNVVARWVNKNFKEHNRNSQFRLTPFVSRKHGYTSLRDIDFSNYLNWVSWCNEVAPILTDNTSIKWRARDVEMTVFTAERNNLELNTFFAR